jgi:HlyD family secretion protein
MRRAKRAAIVAIALVLIAGVLIYSGRRSGSAATIVGA